MSQPLISEPVGARRLRAISYRLLDWEDEPIASALVDSVSTCVELNFTDGTSLTFHWLVRQGYECLTTLPPDPDKDPPQAGRLVDVTDRWHEYRDASLVRVRTSFQETEWGRQPWACRLDFEGSKSLVIALGELADDGTVTYIPDNLVVTDERHLAQGYRPAVAESSAWIDEADPV